MCAASDDILWNRNVVPNCWHFEKAQSHTTNSGRAMFGVSLQYERTLEDDELVGLPLRGPTTS